VLVAARKRGKAVRLDVWDTGAGIADADLRRIFDEFVQVGNTERDRRMGLGLGLSIARRSAALVGATVDVASRPGRGSRFGFIQPSAEPASVPLPFHRPAGTEAVCRPLLRSKDQTLLIVDDDPLVRMALADLLGRWEIRFDVAADGAGALALVDGGARYGLVLADFRLPGRLNGLDMIAAIAERHPQPLPAAALITADFDPALIAAARTAGVPVIPKPLRPPQLRELLNMPQSAGP
jgi:CheY-like chemotaxis protein